MSDFEPSRWEIGKLELKPGQILIVRYTRPMQPDDRNTAAVLKAAKEAFSSALKAAGLKGKVPVLVITDQFDISVICPLEFMDMCVTAKDAIPQEEIQ